MPAAPTRRAVAAVVAAGAVALGTVLALPASAEPRPAGLPRPRPASRTLDAAAVAASVPACEHVVYKSTPRGDVLLADFGGGDKMDPVVAVRVLRAAGFTWADMRTALSVMAAESDRCPRTVHNNIDATGAITSVDYGLWQINTRWHPKYASWDLMDPLTSSRAAKQLYDAAGWTPWHGYANRALFEGWADWAISLAHDAGVR